MSEAYAKTHRVRGADRTGRAHERTLRLAPASKSPPPNLRLGVRALNGLAGAEIVEPLTYDEEGSLWVLRMRLTIGTSSDLVPAVTEWYVLIDLAYPSGLAEFHPAQDGGIHATFRHMKKNRPTDRPWRSGVPCLDRPGRWLGNAALSGQPNDAVGKLSFHTEAALRWLDFAARDALTEADERFELPGFAEKSAEVIGFDESPDRLARWAQVFGRSGRVALRKMSDGTYVVDHFSLGDAIVHPSRWGAHFTALTDVSNAFWITLPEMPMVAPWASPVTWGEFRTVVRKMGVNLDELLKLVYRRIRRGREGDVAMLLVGFPIPDLYDGPTLQVHWQPLRLPEAIGTGNGPVSRFSDKTVWKLQRANTLADEAAIEWGWSENWSEETLRIRGSLDERLRRSRIALVGAGALGSALAEMLVREGCRHVDVFESDWLEVGNLRRHTLTLNDIGMRKSLALAEHLNGVSPFANVRGFAGISDSSDDLDIIREADVVIDCTANEDVIATLSRVLRDGRNRWFFSGAFGVDADRLFLYSERGVGVDLGYYRSEMAAPLAEEWKKIDERGLNEMQNAGCWNPVYPGKWSAIQVRASEMLSAIETTVASGKAEEKALSIIPPARKNAIF
ncbi:MAG: ThiF family adenylyltransferase [Candidatus Dormibacteria bacterium]